MKQQEKDKVERSKHHLQCPDCLHWFDMRDLEAVIKHQHWVEQKPADVSFSHVRELGNEKEFFVKRAGKMITRRLRENNRPSPPHRA